MTLNLSLSTAMENRLAEEAARHGVSAEAYAQQLLEEQLRRIDRGRHAQALIQSWIDVADPSEQQATGDYLIESLDADRPSDRQFFPFELEGRSW